MPLKPNWTFFSNIVLFQEKKSDERRTWKIVLMLTRLAAPDLWDFLLWFPFNKTWFNFKPHFVD